MLKAINGVGGVNVSLRAAEVSVQFDERLVSLDQLILAITGAGYSLDAVNATHVHQSKEAVVTGSRRDLGAISHRHE